MKKNYLFACSFLIVCCIQKVSAQGFLEMPDTAEVPEYERESMLLDLDVPPVRDRDPDPEGGPRLNVKEFKIQGIVEYPKLGIRRQELIERVESIRFDLMGEGKITESGYTFDELGEVSDLIADIEKETEGKHVGPLEVQKMVFLIREQRRKRGITLGMIETVADTITQYYREKGFILAKAYIPQQQVRDGVVTLTLLLGELGEIDVENAKRISPKLIKRVFSQDLNKPVTSWKIEEALYLVNDIPGLGVQGFFSPVSQVGDTKLVVNVREEERYSMNFRIDNHGSENTSENRAYADMYFYNPFGAGDQLHVAVMNTFDPDNSTFGSFRYSSLIFGPRAKISLGVSTNDFVTRNVSASENETFRFFTGKSTVSDIEFKYFTKRSRVSNHSFDLNLANISTESSTAAGADAREDLLKATLRYNFDLLNQKRRQLYVGSVSLIHSDSERDDSFVDAQASDRQESFVAYDFSMLSFPKIPFAQKETRLLLKSSGQYVGKNTSNLNQISLTGANKVRGFAVNGLQADDGIYLGADWIFELPASLVLFDEPLGRVLQPFIFSDISYGILYPTEFGSAGTATTEDPNDGASRLTGELASVGIGLNFNYRGWAASLQLGKAVSDKFSIDVITPTKTFYFDLKYSL